MGPAGGVVMATSTRSRTRRGPVSSAGRRGLGAVAGRMRKRSKRYLDHHPGVALLAMIALGLVSILCLITGILAENLLYMLASGVSTLGAVASARTMHLAQQRRAARQRDSARRPKVTVQQPKQPRPAGTRASGEERPRRGAAPPPPDVIKCTETGKSTDDCKCRTAGHVVSTAGYEKYGGPYGRPLGAKTKTKDGAS